MWVSQQQEGKIILNYDKARDDGIAVVSAKKPYAGWMPFLPPNQQCQSTEGIKPFN